MNRWTDLLASFGLATLLHGLLVLGAVWFWTMRPPELRPIFQGGDVSLAVTFVAAAGDGGQPEEDARRQTPDDGPKRMTDPALPGGYAGQARDAVVETMPGEEEDQDVPNAETATPVSAQASANAPDDKRQPALRSPERSRSGEAGTTDSGQRTAEYGRQGVSSAVRMQSEIRPYYPLGARLRGEEGAVTVCVWVNGSGRALRCEVVRSSGYPVLDESAVDAARRARYVSTQPGAWRAESETTLTFRFRLTE